MRTPIIAALVLAASVANAAPIYLRCEGTTTAVMQGQRDRVVKDLRSLTVDLSTKTVRLEGEDPMQIEQMGEEVIDFASTDPSSLVRGVLLGSINRISGAVWVNIVTLTDGLHIFEGTCKPAQKSF